jgi:hypothetical protein
MFAMQCRTYETLAPLGPVVSALCAGFAIILFGQLYITPAGQRYTGEA